MKYSKWHSAEVKPVYIGVYEKDYTIEKKVYSYWNGKHWCDAQYSIAEAYKEKIFADWYQDDRWRGLAKKPKGLK